MAPKMRLSHSCGVLILPMFLTSLLCGCASHDRISQEYQGSTLNDQVAKLRKTDPAIKRAALGDRNAAHMILVEATRELMLPYSIAGERGLYLIIRTNALLLALGDLNFSEVLRAESPESINAVRFLLEPGPSRVMYPRTSQVISLAAPIRLPAEAATRAM